MAKFKIGDKVVWNKKNSGYIFNGENDYNCEEDPNRILTISCISDNGRHYGFEEDEDSSAHWNNIEDNFDLAKINWKTRLKNV